MERGMFVVGQRDNEFSSKLSGVEELRKIRAELHWAIRRVLKYSEGSFGGMEGR